MEDETQATITNGALGFIIRRNVHAIENDNLREALKALLALAERPALSISEGERQSAMKLACAAINA